MWQVCYNCNDGLNISAEMLRGMMAMAKVRDTDIKKLSTTKQEFMSALKKVSQRVDKAKASTK